MGIELEMEVKMTQKLSWAFCLGSSDDYVPSLRMSEEGILWFF